MESSRETNYSRNWRNDLAPTSEQHENEFRWSELQQGKEPQGSHRIGDFRPLLPEKSVFDGRGIVV